MVCGTLISQCLKRSSVAAQFSVTSDHVVSGLFTDNDIVMTYIYIMCAGGDAAWHGDRVEGGAVSQRRRAQILLSLALTGRGHGKMITYIHGDLPYDWAMRRW